MSDVQFLVDKEFPVYYLECKDSFDNLTSNEKNYAIALIQAGWIGALIDLVQCSSESPGIFLLAQNIFRKQSITELNHLAKSLDLTDEDFKDFLNYFTLFYDNLGNYRSFGDSKFIPRITKEKFTKLIKATDALKDKNIQSIFEKVESNIYSISSRTKQFGFNDEGITTYYSYNFTTDEAKLIQKYLDHNKIEAYNTRVFKTETNNETKYQIRQASAKDDIRRQLSFSDNNANVELVNGDYKELMQLMVQKLHLVKKYSLNNNEEEMFNEYIKSFEDGCVEAHKRGSEHWIRDKNPAVENYIGFIETYRDPLGVRGEFESFIAVVNKPMSARFNSLVKSSPNILKELPWPKEYEKDKFLEPDFTSLDIINFPNSGMPVGINIPNYDEIRQNIGFKNVSLGNVLKARFKDPKANFLKDEDKDLFISRAAEAFEIQVGLHELIGHGSGKLFIESDPSFNHELIIDMKTGKPVTNWYKSNESWDSKFQSLASPFEECRAECVGLYLCNLHNVLEIFGHNPNELTSDDVVYVNWLTMIKSGVVSMEFYTPEQKKWRQAHCEARHAILQVLLEANTNTNFIKIERFVNPSDNKPDIRIHLDRSQIQSVGRPAVGHFLKMLQYYKSTGNVVDGTAYFKKYSLLNEEYLSLRDIVLDRKIPRGVTIQTGFNLNTEVDVDTFIEYPSTCEGMIQSFQDRFKDQYGKSAEDALQQIWERDLHHFQL